MRRPTDLEMTSDNSRWRWVLLAAVVGLGLRIAHLWLLMHHDPLLLAPIIDAAGYHQWALGILVDPVGKTAFFQDPAYSYLLATIYAVVGPDPLAAAVTQALFGAVAVVLVASVAAGVSPIRLRNTAAIIAAWITALYQPLFFYDALLLKVQLTHLFATLALLLYLRAVDCGPLCALWSAASGWVFGVVVLLRGNFYLAVPPLVLWMAWRCYAKLRGTPAGRRSAFRLAIQLGAFCLAFLSVLGAVGLRNRVVSGRWVFTSVHSGSVLYYGNNPHSPDGDFKRLPFVRADPRFEEPDFLAEARRRTGRQLSSRQASQFWRGEAIRYSLSDWPQTLKRLVHKATLIVESYENGDNYSLKFHGEHSWLVKPVIPWWTLVLAFAVAGLLRLRSDVKREAPLLILSGAYLLSLLLFYVTSRYRIGALPFLIVLASGELARWGAWIGAQQYRRLVAPGLVAALVVVLGLWAGVPRQRGENLGVWWAMLGGQHVQHGKLDSGLALMRRGLAADPNNGIVWANLGRLHLRQQRFAAAEAACRRALELPDEAAAARVCVALALVGQGDLEHAAEVLRPAIRRNMPLTRYLLLAQIQERRGLPAEAVRTLRAALAEHGDAPEVRAHIERITAAAGGAGAAPR